MRGERNYRRSDKQRIADAYRIGGVPRDQLPITGLEICRPDQQTGSLRALIVAEFIEISRIGDPFDLSSTSRVGRRILILGFPYVPLPKDRGLS